MLPGQGPLDAMRGHNLMGLLPQSCGFKWCSIFPGGGPGGPGGPGHFLPGGMGSESGDGLGGLFCMAGHLQVHNSQQRCGFGGLPGRDLRKVFFSAGVTGLSWSNSFSISLFVQP